MELRGKKVTVVGLARSGAGAARLLAGLGADVTVTDAKSAEDLAALVSSLPASVHLCLGSHPAELFAGADMIVVSPGVPLDIRPLADARAAGRRIVGELELAFQVLQDLAGHAPVPCIAITGSNGKSTTTTLVDHMLRKGGRKTVLAGNIGNALTEELHAMAGAGRGRMPDVFVLEVSSFQLEAIETFRPHVAAILNITPDHLDRYHGMEAYRAAKAAVFAHQQRGDFLVLNADDLETMRVHAEMRAGRADGPQVLFFSRSREVEGVFVRNGSVIVRMAAVSAGDLELVRTDEILIKGVHNLENAMAASAMALLAKCPVQAVRSSLAEFGGLEHRLEPVREVGRVRFINDSKGTNVGAVLKSLESFAEPLVLIAGGRDKAGDFAALRDVVSRKVRAVVLIGEAAEKIRSSIGDVTTTVMAKDLRDAVTRARSLAQKGDVVLLSPACASFDMFRDFEDRGRQFKEIVMELEASHA